jgi:nucleoside-diphosphate-sugar epimerase
VEKKISSQKKILILGGTRYIGKALVLQLCRNNYDVVLTSRNKLEPINGLNQITCLRSDLKSSSLDLSEFDYVYDFNAYTVADFSDLPEGTPKERYFLISTNWIYKFEQSVQNSISEFSEADERYIIAKRNLELLVKQRFGDKASAVRLPVVIGRGDHHKRLDYYIKRVLQQSKVVCFNTDASIKFVWIDDLINVMLAFVKDELDFKSIVSITPTREVTMKSFLTELAAAYSRELEFLELDIPTAKIALKAVIEADILSNENYFVPTESNVWDLYRASIPSPGERLPKEASLGVLSSSIELALSQEWEYVNGFS